MSVTATTYTERVWQRVSRGNPSAQAQIWRPAIEASLMDALNRLGERVANDHDPQTNARLQKSFAVTLSSGDAAIPATVLAEALPKAQLLLSGTTQPLCYVPYFYDLIYNPFTDMSDYYFWTIHEGKIKVRTSTATIPGATALTLYANYVPLISEVPDEFEGDLVDIGVELVMETMGLQEVESEGVQV